MSKKIGSYVLEQELPIVNMHAVKFLRHSHIKNQKDIQEAMRTTVEEDPEFARQIVIEGNRRAYGDIVWQSAFIEGANFAREAYRRTIVINNLRTIFVD